MRASEEAEVWCDRRKSGDREADLQIFGCLGRGLARLDGV